MEQQKREYDAFISYRHLEQDAEVAENLQRLLEKQTIRSEDGNRKKRTLCVFRDQSELPTSSDLGRDIRTALEKSRYLILICSSSYKKSKWCMEELRYFRSLHGNTNKNILPILLEGEPAESFPELLLWEEIQIPAENGDIQTIKKQIEPLAADIRSGSLKEILKKLRTREYLRIAAPILGVAFDDLYQRKKRMQRRTFAAAIMVFTAFSMAFGFYSRYMYRQIADKQSRILENESVRLANSSFTEMKNQDYMLALLLAKEAYFFYEEADVGEINSRAATALRSTVFGYDFDKNVSPLSSKGIIPFNTEGWNIEASLDEGRVLQVTDGESTYLCSTATGEILSVFSGSRYVFCGDSSLGVKICSLNAYEVLFQGFRTETEEVYFEYTAECRPASYISAFYDDTTNACYFDIDEMIQAYASKEGEIYACQFKDFDLDYLPGSLAENIAAENLFGSYRKNCDIEYDNREAECSMSEGLVMADMEQQGYSEILLTNYNRDLMLVSGKIEESRDEYETKVYSSESMECIQTLEGRYLIDRNSGSLYRRQENQLIIYQLNESRLKQNNLLEDTVYYWLSDNGERCCLLNNRLKDENGQDCDYAQVQVFDIKDMNKPIFCADVNMGGPGSIKYQLDHDMNRIIYEDATGRVQVQELGGESLLTIPFSPDDYIYAVAMDDSGSRAVVAYHGEADYISLYDIAKGIQIAQLDFQEYRGGYSSVEHMEILGDRLLVADYSDVYIFDLQKKEIINTLDGSEHMSPFQRFMTEDGLLFCTEPNDDYYGRQLYYLNQVYDMKSGESVLDISYVAYDYDPVTGFLVYQPFSEYGPSPSIIVMQRQEEGGFQEVWSIKSDNVNMTLLHNGMSLDGNYLLLSGKDTCELYDLSMQYKIMETGFPGFFIKNEKLYYLAKDQYGGLLNWAFPRDMDLLKEKAEELLDGRILSEEERSHYYILGVN